MEGKSDMFVVASGSEGDLRQCEIILGTGQCGVQHQYVALEKRKVTMDKQQCILGHVLL